MYYSVNRFINRLRKLFFWSLTLNRHKLLRIYVAQRCITTIGPVIDFLMIAYKVVMTPVVNTARIENYSIRYRFFN